MYHFTVQSDTTLHGRRLLLIHATDPANPKRQARQEFPLTDEEMAQVAADPAAFDTILHQYAAELSLYLDRDNPIEIAPLVHPITTIDPTKIAAHLSVAEARVAATKAAAARMAGGQNNG